MTDGIETLDGFLDALKSSDPTPGGGAVAGLCGALAGALTHMVAALTVGKKNYAAVDADFRRRMPEMVAAIASFRALMAEDAAAFDGWMSAFRLPKGTEDQKAARSHSLRTATLAASEVPLRTLEASHGILPLVRHAAENGNRNAVSDAGIAALLVTCAAKSAAMNVRINLASLKGDDHARVSARLERTLGPTLEEAGAIEDLVGGMLA